jgi:hypothetical protein
MNKDRLRQLFEQVQSGKIEIDRAVDQLKQMPFVDLGFAKLDTHRDLRRGFPEVIFCPGKTVEQVADIFDSLAESGRFVMASRASVEIFGAIRARHPEAEFHAQAQIVLSGPIPAPRTDRKIAVVSAGTSDIPVAEEAAVTAESMGNPVERLYDVGVAGLHRLLHHTDKLFEASVIIVVAGMEGALASVVGGMVGCPVIAVPTSVGYGASFQGLAALLAMLNSCAPGVAVMNIDNGFGAGYFAAIVNLIGK